MFIEYTDALIGLAGPVNERFNVRPSSLPASAGDRAHTEGAQCVVQQVFILRKKGYCI